MLKIDDASSQGEFAMLRALVRALAARLKMDLKKNKKERTPGFFIFC